MAKSLNPRSASSKPRKNVDVLTLIENAYRPAESEASWLRDVGEASRPLIDEGLGLVVYFFDKARSERIVFGAVSLGGADPEFARILPPTYDVMPSSVRARLLWGAPAASTGSELIPPALLPGITGPFRCGDALGVTVSDASGRGCILNALLPTPRRVDALSKVRWSRITAHLASGLRLNRSLLESAASGVDAAASHEEAIVDPDGRVQHAVGLAREPEARDTLRRAVSVMERARGSLRRRDNDRALELWPALVDGRWSLVERFESDGRRYLVAMKNDIEVADPRSLTPRERLIASYVGLGRTNKLIAYELGIAQGTVATLIARVNQKLGTRSRAELVDLWSGWQTPDVSVDEVTIGTSELVIATRGARGSIGLSPYAERIARAAAEGLSNAAIAARVGRSSRAVARTLERVFRTLEISSRAELARYLAEKSTEALPDQDPR